MDRQRTTIAAVATIAYLLMVSTSWSDHPFAQDVQSKRTPRWGFHFGGSPDSASAGRARVSAPVSSNAPSTDQPASPIRQTGSRVPAGALPINPNTNDWLQPGFLGAGSKPNWLSQPAPLPRSAVPATKPQRLSAPRRRSAASAKTSNELPVAGTWREEGDYIILELNGQKVRLRKERAAPTAAQTATTARPRPQPQQRLGVATVAAEQIVSENQMQAGSPIVSELAGGIVFGRLMQGPKPLTKCQVSLIPLEKSGREYNIDSEGEPQTTHTDAEGRYRFEDVPPGRYKLYWLPVGTRRWIRRLDFKPDVVVRSYQASEIKTVRMSLRTLN